MEIIQKDQQPHFSSQVPSMNINAGAVEVESKRAVAEALAQVRLAQMVGRDLNAIYAEVQEVCSLPAMAEVAFYELPQGGEKVSGPSIKLIEQVASAMGHFEWGHRELSRVDATPDSFGRSEIEVYVWDKLKNNRSIRQITVLHVRDSKYGAQPLKYQKDIDNYIANVAAKQMRGRLQALLPKWLVESAIQICRETLKGSRGMTIPERVRKMIEVFAGFGIKHEMLAKYLGIKNLENVTIDQLTSLLGVYQALKDGARISDYFSGETETEASEVSEPPAANNSRVVNALNALPDATPQTEAIPPQPTKAAPEPEKVTAEQEQPAPEPAARKTSPAVKAESRPPQQGPTPEPKQPEPKPKTPPEANDAGILF